MTEIDKLQRVQNACAHVILIRLKRHHIMHILLELHWLPAKSRITFKTLILTLQRLWRCSSIF